VHGDYVLLFHPDSIVCRESPHALDAFLEWDYVGAPWAYPNGSYSHDLGGNSGLSLRNRHAMVRLLRERADDVAAWLARHTDGWGEDVFIGRYGHLVGMRVAPQEVAKLFSVESKFYPRPWGIHKPWAYLPRTKLRELVRHCNDSRIIVPPWYLIEPTPWLP
jgi:hypothetical protein